MLVLQYDLHFYAQIKLVLPLAAHQSIFFSKYKYWTFLKDTLLTGSTDKNSSAQGGIQTHDLLNMLPCAVTTTLLNRKRGRPFLMAWIRQRMAFARLSDIPIRLEPPLIPWLKGIRGLASFVVSSSCCKKYSINLDEFYYCKIQSLSELQWHSNTQKILKRPSIY